MKKTDRASVCPECGSYFTPSGLRMHRDSFKCELNQKIAPLKREAHKEKERLLSEDKSLVTTNVAKALRRRGLEEMTGLEEAKTNLVVSDINCYISEQFWVYKWVKLIWEYYREEGYTIKAYNIFEKLLTLSEEDRQNELGLILLKVCNGRF